MSSRLEVAFVIFRSYVITELLRNKGIIFGLLSLAVWMILFIVPISLFSPPGVDRGVASAYAFTAVLVFMSYSMAAWDWAWVIRWALANNILEYIIASGRSIFILYLGVMPVSIIWILLALITVYALLSALIAPPYIVVRDPLLLVMGLTIFAIVLFSHALILGGTIISAGTSGPVMEFISWLLPIATGGVVPLKNLPPQVQKIALATPYSYPAELIRYSLLGTETVLGVTTTLVIGIVYSLTFLAATLYYFERQLKKMLKEGPKSIGMY